MRTTLTTVTAVLVLQHEHHSHRVMCPCSQMVRFGTCAHAHFVRFLEGDNVSLASQAEMIAKDSEGTVEDADSKLRKRLGGRPLQLPSASAWCTLEYIRKQHAKKMAEKKRA